MTETHTSHESSTLLEYFERVAIINLPERADRRQQMERQLKAFGIDPAQPPIEFFAGIRPSEPGGWPSIGCRGGFLSHYAVLKQARESGLRNIAVLEDDCMFRPGFGTAQADFRKALCEAPWDLVWLGHHSNVDASPAGLFAWQPPPPYAHVYAVNGRVLGRVVD